MGQDVVAMAKRIGEAKQEIAAECVKDPEFRKKLLANPGATIEEHWGLNPGSFAQVKFNIVEESPDSILIPIPAAPKDDELSDDQLEAVAGGFAFSAAVTAAVVGGIAAGVSAIGVTATAVQNSRAGRNW